MSKQKKKTPAPKKRRSPVFRKVSGVQSGIPVPAEGDEIRKRKTRYPWNTMKLEQSFTVDLLPGDEPSYVINLVHANYLGARKAKTVAQEKRFIYKYMTKDKQIRVWRVK